MDDRIAYADELAGEFKVGEPFGDRGKRVQEAVRHTHPIYIGVVDGITYDSKSDRYTIKFEKSSLKIATDAAAFYLTNSNDGVGGMKPTVYAKMAQGEVVSVLLLFISRD